MLMWRLLIYQMLLRMSILNVVYRALYLEEINRTWLLNLAQVVEKSTECVVELRSLTFGAEVHAIVHQYGPVIDSVVSEFNVQLSDRQALH